MATELNTSKLTPENHVLLVRRDSPTLRTLALIVCYRTNPFSVFLTNWSSEISEIRNDMWNESETTSSQP